MVFVPLDAPHTLTLRFIFGRELSETTALHTWAQAAFAAHPAPAASETAADALCHALYHHLLPHYIDATLEQTNTAGQPTARFFAVRTAPEYKIPPLLALHLQPLTH